MKTVNVEITQNENKNYCIYVGSGAKQRICEVVTALAPKKIVVVTNETIYELYSDTIAELFKTPNTTTEFCILPDGEIYKNKSSLETILSCAFETKLERNDLFVAFGGGVIGDITGLAAAIYLRGINFIQVPTTILAQVDSSVGGKVAINTSYGKNLIGAFYQPKAVVTDLDFLKTLPKREILTGLSEVIKYSFIEKSCGGEFSDFARFLFSQQKDILNLKSDALEKMIETSCKLKSLVVTQDEKEKGLRAILNFGHTIGHAIEKCTKYNLFTHGEAVAIGMKAAFLISMQLGKINKEYFDFSIELLKSFDLNFKIPSNISVDELKNALLYDKKIKNGQVRFILPVGYAKVEVFSDIDNEIISNVLKELY